jgi:hypothetical protein
MPPNKKEPEIKEIPTQDDNETTAGEIVTETMDTGESVDDSNKGFIAAIREMAETSFKNYPTKTTNISEDNASGIIAITVLNDWMLAKYGYQYQSLQTLVKAKRENVMSVKGYGLEQFIKELASVQTIYQQSDIPNSLANRLRRQ